MSVLDKLPRRFKNRVRLVFAAIFSKSSDLEATMISTSKAYEFLNTTPPNVVLRGWGNPYDILPGVSNTYDSLDNETLQFADRKKHPQSSEEDVLKLLYSITRQTKSKTIIEVGVFHGAASQGDLRHRQHVHPDPVCAQRQDSDSAYVCRANWWLQAHGPSLHPCCI